MCIVLAAHFDAVGEVDNLIKHAIEKLSQLECKDKSMCPQKLLYKTI